MEHVQGKVAFVTGGASGIGLGIVKAMLGAGMKVMIADIQKENMDNAKAELAGLGEFDMLQLDVTDRKAVAKAAADTVKRFGKVHVLVNNAGVGVLGPIAKAKYGDWDWAMGVNLGGAINCFQEFLPKIQEHGEGGHIVNTCSMAAVIPIPNASIYVTAKAGLMGFSESIRAELAPENIGVSAFCPGPVQSNIGKAAGKLRPAEYREESGYKEVEDVLAARPIAEEWMSKEECGERVLGGIRNNDLFIFTHREFKEGTEARCRKIVNSYPDEPINEARAAIIPMLTSNKIYAE